MYERYNIEFDWYFGTDGKGKSFAEEYLTDAIKYLQERVRNTSLPTAERYEVQEMVNGLFNLRNAIRDAEEIVYGEMNFI